MVNAAPGHKVLLFDDADLDETIKRPKESDSLQPTIQRYLSERSSQGGEATASKTDAFEKKKKEEEADDEDLEADYDCMSRGTVKAKSSALNDVMNGIEGVKINALESKMKSSGGGRPPPPPPTTRKS